MPIFESSEVTRRELHELRKHNVCAICGGWLNMFLGDNGLAFVACADWRRTYHDGVARIATARELNIETRREDMEKTIGVKKTRVLERYSYGALTTEKGAMTVLDTIWPEAPRSEKVKAALICIQYQLNPLMKHLFLIPFNEGKPNESWAVVLGIQATRLIAHRAGDYSYVDATPRVMTKEEQERIFGEVFDDRIWAITKLRDSKGNEAVGYGFWLKSQNPYGSDKGNTKANMAFIRSERQALDRLFAGWLPEQAIEVADERFLNQDTGEIIDVTPEPTSDSHTEPAQVTVQETETKEPSRRDQIFVKIKENKPALRTNANVRSWLVGVCKIPAAQVDDENDLSWWETVKALQGWKD